MNECPVSVVIPTYNRAEDLLEALKEIQSCDPHPCEIIVHVDGDDNTTEAAIKESSIEDVTVICSGFQVGPGGGRNAAITRAKCEIVASFDDDSYPIDSDYFARLLQLFEQFPQAAVIGAAIYHIDESIKPDDLSAQWEHSFIGCGCAYRKSVFQSVEGYVALPVAYGMEEVDLALRLHNAEWKILVSPWLRVFHNTRLAHHSSTRITAATISNQALLAYLRYPRSLWWIGIGQCLSRIVWLGKNDRYNGIFQGITDIPKAIMQHRSSRYPITAKSLRSFLLLKRQAIAASFPTQS